MRKQLLSIVIFFMLLVFGLTGCFEEKKDDNNGSTTNGNDDNKENVTNESNFIGKWVVIDDLNNWSIGDVYTFYEDGKLIISYAGFLDDVLSVDLYDFKVEDNKLCQTLMSNWSCFDYEFINENNLVIFMSGAMTLEKFNGYSSDPIIDFDVDTVNSSLSVNYINQTDLYWDDFEVIGNATSPSGQVDFEDTITNCTGNILIRHISSNTFQGVWVV